MDVAKLSSFIQTNEVRLSLAHYLLEATLRDSYLNKKVRTKA
jgi:hypothetical protein